MLFHEVERGFFNQDNEARRHRLDHALTVRIWRARCCLCMGVESDGAGSEVRGERLGEDASSRHSLTRYTRRTYGRFDIG